MYLWSTNVLLVGLYDVIQMLRTVQMYHKFHHHGQLSITVATRLPSSVHSAPPTTPSQHSRTSTPVQELPFTAVTLCHLTLMVRTSYFSFPSLLVNTDPCPADTWWWRSAPSCYWEPSPSRYYRTEKCIDLPAPRRIAQLRGTKDPRSKTWSPFLCQPIRQPVFILTRHSRHGALCAWCAVSIVLNSIHVFRKSSSKGQGHKHKPIGHADCRVWLTC